MAPTYIRNSKACTALGLVLSLCGAFALGCATQAVPNTPANTAQNPPDESNAGQANAAYSQNTSPQGPSITPDPSSPGSAANPVARPPATPPPEAAAQPSQPAASTDGTSTTMLQDGDVVAIEVAADKAEIKQGELAQLKAKHPEVKRFAAQMVAAHGKDLYKLTQLELSENIVANPTSRDAISIEQASREDVGSLRRKTGKDFDKAYMERQVTGHEQVIRTLDAAIPNVKNDNLKAHLTELRAHAGNHLREAQQILGKL